MITYKNITEVEVVNEIPENATALINDGGELKQVACEKMGGNAGGVATAIIKIDGYDNALVGIATAREDLTFTFTCTNMTFDEAVQIIMSGEPLAVIGMNYYEGWGSLSFINFNHVEYIAFYYTIPTIMCKVVGDDSYTIYWTPNGISNREPQVPTES